MPSSADTPNQVNSQTNQNFSVDINQLAKDWIIPIDNLRSYIGLNPQNAAIFAAVSQGGSYDITNAVQLIKIEQTAQESRCHAFFRWIGFPVVSATHQIYNPGFDIVRNKSQNRTIKLKDQISIANNPIAQFNDLSLARETAVQKYLAIFSDPTSVDAGTLALSSGGTANLRLFSVPFAKDSTPFDMTVNDQQYQADLNGLVGENTILLTAYQNANGTTPSKLTINRTHIIKPFIVDARIDFSVSPQSRLVAVPFVPDSSYTKVDSVNNVIRPLIEKIIRDRFNPNDLAASSGTAVGDVLNGISESSIIKDNDLISMVNNSSFSVQQQFTQTINTITTLMQQLVKDQNIISQAQSDYYWLPAPSATGPENGSTVQGVFLPTVIDSSLITDKDGHILISKANTIVNSISAQSAAITGSPLPPLSDYGLATTTFGSDTTQGLGDNSGQNLETLSQKRLRILTKASEALSRIEIVMGEFSGLGLCDIIAIIGALNVIAKEDLLGFLDADALTRAKTSANIGNTSATSYDTAMSNLATAVKNFYNIMDKIYADILSNNGIS